MKDATQNLATAHRTARRSTCWGNGNLLVNPLMRARRIEAAVQLFGDGRISREEYLRRVEINEREIAHWQTRTTETEKMALELAMCAEALDKLVRLWEISSNEDKQGLARSLFSYIVYDLDSQRIVDFRLKPWADRFLILRAALYEDDGGEGQGPEGKGQTGEGQAAEGSTDDTYKDMTRSPLWGT